MYQVISICAQNAMVAHWFGSGSLSLAMSTLLPSRTRLLEPMWVLNSMVALRHTAGNCSPPLAAHTDEFLVRIPFPRLTFVGRSRIGTEDELFIWRLTGADDGALVIHILSARKTSHDPFG